MCKALRDYHEKYSSRVWTFRWIFQIQSHFYVNQGSLWFVRTFTSLKSLSVDYQLDQEKNSRYSCWECRWSRFYSLRNNGQPFWSSKRNLRFDIVSDQGECFAPRSTKIPPQCAFMAYTKTLGRFWRKFWSHSWRNATWTDYV